MGKKKGKKQFEWEEAIEEGLIERRIRTRR